MSRTRRFLVGGTAVLIAGLGVLAAAPAGAAPEPSDSSTTVESPNEPTTEASESTTTVQAAEPPVSEPTITTVEEAEPPVSEPTSVLPPTTTDSPEPPTSELITTTTVEEALLVGPPGDGNASAELHDGPNDYPEAQDDFYTLRFGEELSVGDPGLLANDSDPDGDPLSINAAWVHPPTGGALPGESLIVDGDGSFSYQSPAGFVGRRVWTYGTTDGEDHIDNASIIFTMLGHPPTAWTDVYTAEPGKVLNVSSPGVLTNDTDTDGQTLAVAGFGAPDGGLLPGEYLNVEFDGTLAYVPPTGFQGTRTWSYVVSDTDGDTDEGFIVFKVFSHVPPVAVSDNYMTEVNTPKIIDAPGVLANDSDFDGDMLTVTEFGEVNGTTLPGESLQVNPDGSFTYVPPTDYVGQRSFMYRATDGEYLVDGELNIFINGTPQSSPPEPTIPADPEPEPTMPVDPEPEPTMPVDPEPEPTIPADPEPEPTFEDQGTSETETTSTVSTSAGGDSGTIPTTTTAPVTTTMQPMSGQLPATGTASTGMVLLAVVTLGAGVGLRIVARRRS